MRFLAAALVFLLSTASLLYGVAMQTVWAPETQVEHSISFDSTSKYALLEPELIGAYADTVDIRIAGDEKTKLISGRESDLRAWLDGTDWVLPSLLINSNQEISSLYSRDFSGDNPPNSVTGFDVFISELEGNALLEQSLEYQPGIAYIIASDGVNPVPASLRMTWQVEPPQVLSGPFLGASIVGYLLSLLILVSAIRKQNFRPRRQGPKLPKPPPVRRALSSKVSNPAPKRKGRRAKFVAIGLSAGLLAGCAPQYPDPALNPSPPEQQSIPTLNQAQFEEILAEITESTSLGDETQNREILDARLAGPSLSFRSAYYTLLTRSDEITPPKPISDQLQLALPTRSESWPRVGMMIVGEGTNESPLQALFIRQESVRENYRLWYNIELLPNIDFPEVAALERGSVPIGQDSGFLNFKVSGLVPAIGNLIDYGLDSISVNVIDPDNQYIAQASDNLLALKTSLENALVENDHELGDENIIQLSTTDAGALVAFYMIDQTRISPTEVAEAIAVDPGPEQVLLGSEASATGVETRYGTMLLAHIPSAQSDRRVRILGASQVLQSVTRLEGDE
jgi:hypothetical protein